MSGGIKYDQGKARISLLPGRAIEQVMKVGEMGAAKYGDHNYRLGMPVTKFLNAAFRHAFVEWLFKGVDNDPESGLPHLAHAAWNMLAALEQMLTMPEHDDRFSKSVPNPLHRGTIGFMNPSTIYECSDLRNHGPAPCQNCQPIGGEK